MGYSFTPMTKDARKGIVAIAVEDDAVLLTYALVDPSDAEWSSAEVAGRTAIPRTQYSPGNQHEDLRVAEPESVIGLAVQYVDQLRQRGQRVDAIGLSIFGTVNRDTNVWSHIPNRGDGAGKTMTIDFRRELGARTSVRAVYVDNDATAAALGEQKWGAGKYHNDAFAYIWAGRGVNVGLVMGSESWEGFMHPEMGHMYPQIHDDDADYVARCRDERDTDPRCIIHHTCLMALTSYRAVQARLDMDMTPKLVANIQAYYIAQLCHTLTVTLSIGRIAVGGYLFRSGLLRQHDLLGAIQVHWEELRGPYGVYVQSQDAKSYIVEAKCGLDASLLGVLEGVRVKLAIDG